MNHNPIEDMKKIIVRHASAEQRYSDGSLCSVSILVQELGTAATIFLAIAEFCHLPFAFPVGNVYTLTGNGHAWRKDSEELDAAMNERVSAAWRIYAQKNSCNLL